jgi:amino acid transporter
VVDAADLGGWPFRWRREPHPGHGRDDPERGAEVTDGGGATQLARVDEIALSLDAVDGAHEAGVFVGGLAAFLPINVLLALVNMGTLLAFVVVCASVLVMRRTHPETRRPFRVPFVPLVPILGIVSCLLLMFSLPPENWLRLVVWAAIGLAIYFGYGRWRSILAQAPDGPPPSLAESARQDSLQT